MEKRDDKSDLRKKGDVGRADNDRPSCTRTLVSNRLHSRLDTTQLPEQKWFRRSFQTLDHIATLRVLMQRSHEWCVKMWTAMVNCTKTFDTIREYALWKALARFGIDTPTER